MDSAPLEILNLGLEVRDYELMSFNIKNAMNMPFEQRAEIFRRANKELSQETREIALEIIYHMSNDREVYDLLEIPYCDGPPEGDFFSCAVVDYLLKNKSRLIV
jgi:hypothetical protein